MSMEPKHFSRGAELSYKTTTYIPAEARIRPLRDQLIVEPIDANISAIIILIEDKQPVRGIVRAAGPGVFPWKYDHPDKHRRTKMWSSKRLRPCDVKVGDVVDFEPRTFQTLYWGQQIMLVIREEDVTGLIEEEHGAAA